MSFLPRSVIAILLIALLGAGLAALGALDQRRLVRLHAVGPTPLVQHVIVTGRVITPSRVLVGSEIMGVVQERRVAEGDRVAPGDILVILRDNELAARLDEAEATLGRLVEADRPQAEVALREAEARLAQARREARRRRQLHERGLAPAETMELAEQVLIIEQAAADRARLAVDALRPDGPEETTLRARAEALRAALDRTVIRASVPGIVLSRAAEPGDLIQPGQKLFEIARDDRLEVSVHADERHLSRLALGQRASCITDAYPDAPFEAQLAYIAPVVDPERGTIELRLRVIDPPPWIRQDMTVTASIETGQRDAALVVPDDALRERAGSRARVQVAEDGRARTREIRLGLRGDGRSEVSAGLRPGDQVIIDPVPEGAAVRERRGPTR